MALLDGFKNLFGGFGLGQPAKRVGYNKTLQASDFSTSTTACVTTAYVKIGSYSVPAQQSVNVGYGSASQPDNQGYLYVVSKTSANGAMEGMLRILVANANETIVVKVFEERTDVLSGSATARTSKVAFPEDSKASAGLGRNPRQDDLIQLWFKPDTAGTWSPTYSTAYIPVTVYAL